MTNAVTLITNEQEHNNLGIDLAGPKHRFPRLRNFFGIKDKPRYVTRAPNDRVSIKRKAHDTLRLQYQREPTGPKKNEIHAVLVALNDGSIETMFPSLQESGIPTIKKLGKDLVEDTEKTFDEIAFTIDCATKTKFGIVDGGKGKNANLATAITTYSTLYDGKLQNPLLPEQNNVPGADFLREDIDKVADGTPHKDIIEKQLGIASYCRRMGDATDNFMAMSKSTLNMAFSSVQEGVPGDDVKSTIVRDIKIATNRFWRDVSHDEEYVNLKAQRKQILEQRKEHHRLHEKEQRKILNEKQLAALDAMRKLDQDGKKLRYQRMPVDVNRLAQEDFAQKQKVQRLKKTLFVIAILFAIFVAGGQMAIALGGALTAGASAFAYIVGIASFATNYFLFQRDITGVLVDMFTGRMFKGLSTGLKIGLGVYGVFSVVTGLVSAALATGSFLQVLGFASIMAAPAGPLAVMIALVGIPTFIGMGALFFAVGVGIAKKIQNIVNKYDPNNPNEKAYKKIARHIRKKWRQFFKPPQVNRQALKIKEQIKQLEIKHARAQDNPTLQRDLGIQLKFLQKKHEAAIRTHAARHILKIILTVVFIPLSILFAVVATFGLMRVSVKETLDLALSMQIPKAMAETVANVLTWGFAVVVNGALYAQNLTVAAKFFGDKLAKFFTSVGYGFAMMGILISEGKFFRSIKQAIQVYRDNPRKVLYPGFRAGLLIGFLVLVILNAHGNAKLYQEKGTFPIPDNKFITGRMLTYFSSFLGSATLNFIAGYAAQYSTPQKRLQRDEGKESSYGAVTKAANDSDGLDKGLAKSDSQATRAFDTTAATTTESMPANPLMSASVSDGKSKLKVRLPKLRFWSAPYSKLAEEPVDHTATNGLTGQQQQTAGMVN